MRLPRLLKLVLPLAGGCLLLSILYVGSVGIDPRIHHRYDADIQVVQAFDTQLNQDVLRLRMGLLQHYDGIVQDLEALQRLEEHLLRPPSFLPADVRSSLAETAGGYAAAAKEKARFVEQFKSTNAALRSSIRFFPVASRQLRDGAARQGARSLAKRADALLEAVLEYEVVGSQPLRQRALRLLAELEASPQRRDLLATLQESAAAHARNILMRRDELDLLIQEIDAAPTQERLAALQHGYREAYAVAHERAETYRWLLYLVGALTVAATVHALRALARAKRTLEEANASLDLRVRERTAELQELNAELENSNRELDDFAYIASHDLKEPLRGIHNYASFLIEDYGESFDAEGRSKLETLGRLAKRMDTLIDTLLHFSRVGRTELACAPTSIQEVVEDVADSLHISLEEKSVELRIPETLPTVHCDRVWVTELFRNLISNAMKYNDKAEKWIEVGVLPPSEEKAMPVFYVRDNGIGIREKHIESVFRIFKRLHGRDKFGGGTGAGLTIVKKIAERHGGRAWLESEYGEGTTFFVDLGGSEDAHEGHTHHGG